MKIVKKSTESYHFYSRGKSLYIAWACFRNETPEKPMYNDLENSLPSKRNKMGRYGIGKIHYAHAHIDSIVILNDLKMQNVCSYSSN